MLHNLKYIQVYLEQPQSLKQLRETCFFYFLKHYVKSKNIKRVYYRSILVQTISHEESNESTGKYSISTFLKIYYHKNIKYVSYAGKIKVCV